ncbi:MAG: globin domain-containing protein [Clostridium perfringens]|nr:globin domain-containing protein [Clostridium perfringens]
MLSEETIALVQHSIPLLKKNEDDILSLFYKKLFEADEVIKEMFNKVTKEKGKQPMALIKTLIIIAQNLDDLSKMKPMIKIVSTMHVQRHVQKNQYIIVKKCFLDSMKEILGDKLSLDTLNAWSKSYDTISKLFINTEEKLYKCSMS